MSFLNKLTSITCDLSAAYCCLFVCRSVLLRLRESLLVLPGVRLVVCYWCDGACSNHNLCQSGLGVNLPSEFHNHIGWTAKLQKISTLKINLSLGLFCLQWCNFLGTFSLPEQVGGGI